MVLNEVLETDGTFICFRGIGFYSTAHSRLVNGGQALTDSVELVRLAWTASCCIMVLMCAS